MPPFREILAERIGASPVSMTKLAREAGMDPALLSRACRGLKPFPSRHARSLGVALGLSGGELADFVVEAHLDASTPEIRAYVDALRRQGTVHPGRRVRRRRRADL